MRESCSDEPIMCGTCCTEYPQDAWGFCANCPFTSQKATEKVAHKAAKKASTQGVLSKDAGVDKKLSKMEAKLRQMIGKIQETRKAAQKVKTTQLCGGGDDC